MSVLVVWRTASLAGAEIARIAAILIPASMLGNLGGLGVLLLLAAVAKLLPLAATAIRAVRLLAHPLRLRLDPAAAADEPVHVATALDSVGLAWLGPVVLHCDEAVAAFGLLSVQFVSSSLSSMAASKRPRTGRAATT